MSDQTAPGPVTTADPGRAPAPGYGPGLPPGTVAVLANSTAGRGRHRSQLPEILSLLRTAGRPVELLSAADSAGAEAASAAAVAGGAAALIAVGGDGTVHRALQAVAGTGVPFGVVAAGSGNDFAAELGLPTEPLAAARTLAGALRGGWVRAVDLARLDAPPPAEASTADAAGAASTSISDGYLADGGGPLGERHPGGAPPGSATGARAAPGPGRWFGAVLAAGFDAIVNERANRMRVPRGPRRYDLAILAELLRLRPRRYRLVLDGVATEVAAVLVAVGNTASYGGGLRICPTADPADGLLDVVVGGRFSRTELIRTKPRVRRGTHLGHPLVTALRAGTVEVVALDEPIVGYADGERIAALPAVVSCVPGALRLLGPEPR